MAEEDHQRNAGESLTGKGTLSELFESLQEVCSYKSQQYLRIPEPRLGALYWFLVLALIALSCLVVFSGGLHQERAAGVGTVSTLVRGKAFFGSRGYDPADLALGAQESDGAFIATRIVTQRGQAQGDCIDYDRKCPCAEGWTCVSGFCKGPSWCPSLGDGNVKGPPPDAPAEAGTEPTVESFEGLGQLTLSLNAGISFLAPGDPFFVAGDTSGAHNPYGNVTLDALLADATPPVALQDLVEYGGVIGVSFLWACDLQRVPGKNESLPCEPSVLVQRLDGGRGYQEKHARRYSAEDKQQRDAVYAFGIKVHVTSSGEGRWITPILFMLQIGLALSLLVVAPWVVDLVLLLCYSEEYQRQKIKGCTKEIDVIGGPHIESSRQTPPWKRNRHSEELDRRILGHQHEQKSSKRVTLNQSAAIAGVGHILGGQKRRSHHHHHA